MVEVDEERGERGVSCDMQTTLQSCHVGCVDMLNKSSDRHDQHKKASSKIMFIPSQGETI